MSKNSPPSALDTSFRQLWHSFAANYGGLRLFSEQLSSLADRLDAQPLEEMANVMADVFGDPIETVRAELREFLPALDEDHLYPDFFNQPDARAAFEAFQDSAFKRRVLRWLRKNAPKSHRFLSVWTDYTAQPPLSGIVLRQSALINLVSTMEIFVDGVTKIYHDHVDPNRPFKDRPTWKDRWETLQEFALLSLWQAYQAPLREIIARRNALIHQGGRITSDGYLKQTEDVAALRPPGAAEGRFLLVPTTYLAEALDTSLLFAFSLSQSAWRAWRKRHHAKTADKLASDLIYQTLRQKRYALVEKLADMAIELKPAWKFGQIILTNRAIACREQGKTDELQRVLGRLEQRRNKRWDIGIAIHILRCRFEQARIRLKESADKGKLNELSPYWPLFDPVRGEPWFTNLFDAAHSALPHSKGKKRR